MLCENCGENEANVRYTQIINGVKKEMNLCENCANEKGITNMDFNMPISFSSFLSDIFDGYNDTNFLPDITKTKTLKCKKCGLTYDEFIDKGKFGCANCYDTFSDKIDYLVKNLHGSTRHIGRKSKYIKENESKIVKEDNQEANKEMSKLDLLKKDLKDAIKDERYEDAAKIRDKIKKIEG